jgi:hypothetical protein
MSLKLSRCLINRLFIRRFASKDSSLTTTEEKKEVTTTTKKSATEITKPKRAFTLIDPKTVHQIKRIDDTPINNTMDFVRHRLTENRTYSNFKI